MPTLLEAALELQAGLGDRNEPVVVDVAFVSDDRSLHRFGRLFRGFTRLHELGYAVCRYLDDPRVFDAASVNLGFSLPFEEYRNILRSVEFEVVALGVDSLRIGFQPRSYYEAVNRWAGNHPVAANIVCNLVAACIYSSLVFWGQPVHQRAIPQAQRLEVSVYEQSGRVIQINGAEGVQVILPDGTRVVVNGIGD